MTLVAQIAAIGAGTIIVWITLSAAVRTVVVPRGEQILLNRIVFRVVREAFETFARPSRPYLARDRVMARYAPTALMTLPFVWSVGIISGFSLIFWGLEVRPYRNALVLAGSSVTTLGFERADALAPLLVAIAEGLIGLALVALLISFLPTMYGHFSKREVMVTQLHNWANDGGVARPATVLIRAQRIGGYERLHQTWIEWERWFVELEETHTSFPALALFRSPDPSRSWITVGAVALDSAALFTSCVNTQYDPAASVMMRSGYLALRQVADFFGVPYNPDPKPDDPISVLKEEFMAVYEELASAGVPVRPDRERAWRDFAGWRVNYDETVIALASLYISPEQPWVTDRQSAFFRSPVFRKK